MNRSVLIFLCAILGLVMIGVGLLVPAHLRAVDRSVIEAAGLNTPTLTDRGLALLEKKNLGAAQLFSQTAQANELPGWDKLATAVTQLAVQQPDLIPLGHDETGLHILFGIDRVSPGSKTGPITDFLVRQANRQQALNLLGASANPVVQELLRFRNRTNTAIFSPSQSASGQALDTAVAVCGLLLERGRLNTGLSNTVLVLAADANSRKDSLPLEQVLLDLMSLGQRFNWGQLLAFADSIGDAETLRRLAFIIRKGEELPVLFCAVQLSGQPVKVAEYLLNYSQTGLRDLGESLRFGTGGVNELLRRNQRLSTSEPQRRVVAHAPFGTVYALMAGYSLRTPWLALTAKWLLYLGGGFLLAVAAHYTRRVPELERPLQVRGFHFASEFLIALGFLFVVLLLSEPFLAQDSQKAEMPFRLRLSMVGSESQTGSASAEPTFMNQSNLNLLTMLLFFVIQGLLYVACLVKLAEIRRQSVPPRIKLKLLENEDHLFDAGLYLGFLGTIVSFVVYSLWAAHQFSLMVAYSSTSFGIIFVSLFKICHLRPLRRKLVLEAEAVYPEPPVPTVAPTYQTPS
jgi:uncharacterized membrane protein